MTDYCKHGVFVGGCGIDWMCHACEMGDVEPTPAELFERATAKFAEMVTSRTRALMFVTDWKATKENPDQLDKLEQQLLNGDESIVSLLSGRRRVEFNAAVSSWHESTLWAEGPDDNDWLARRHRILTEQEEADRADWSTADHIAALPLHVQEGSY